ncbi:bile acid:sodium symporter family protein [Streptomyces sp. NPDC091292]|uniref:bile acid:sodium symporter family protein n=1 Tax=Streptomyces sp. NPDC091292 TaxID=3365991 RepID=UPI00380DCF6C
MSGAGQENGGCADVGRADGGQLAAPPGPAPLGTVTDTAVRPDPPDRLKFVKFPRNRLFGIGKGRLRFPKAVDPYVAALAGTVVLACLLPATGRAADIANITSELAIGLLFFLYGARLSTRETLAGLRHVRLHTLVLLSTFVLFPLLGLGAVMLPQLPAQLQAGVLFLCVVPSTVQSAVALTALAKGDVPAAICAGTYSSLVGLAATPLLAAWLIGSEAALSMDGLLRLGAQLLAPFIAGQLLRRWIGGFVARHKRVLGPVDRASILLVVYAAFSSGMNQGVWQQVTVASLLVLVAVLTALFFVALGCTTAAARLLGLDPPARIAAVLCGSQKSLASGLPMAAVLFGGQAALIVLPLMAYHQLQLVICAGLARRWSRPSGHPVLSTPPPARPRPDPT